jgi:hypothetical protein
MSAIPVAVPLAWTGATAYILQSVRFRVEIGSDCLLHREYIR